MMSRSRKKAHEGQTQVKIWNGLPLFQQVCHSRQAFQQFLQSLPHLQYADGTPGRDFRRIAAKLDGIALALLAKEQDGFALKRFGTQPKRLWENFLQTEPAAGCPEAPQVRAPARRKIAKQRACHPQTHMHRRIFGSYGQNELLTCNRLPVWGLIGEISCEVDIRLQAQDFPEVRSDQRYVTHALGNIAEYEMCIVWSWSSCKASCSTACSCTA